MPEGCGNTECPFASRLETRMEDYRKADTATHKELWSAINELKTNDAVQDSKYDTILNTLRDVTAEVKALQAVPSNNWRDLVKTLLTTAVAAIIGFAMAKIGF